MAEQSHAWPTPANYTAFDERDTVVDSDRHYTAGCKGQERHIPTGEIVFTCSEEGGGLSYGRACVTHCGDRKAYLPAGERRKGMFT